MGEGKFLRTDRASTARELHHCAEPRKTFWRACLYLLISGELALVALLSSVAQTIHRVEEFAGVDCVPITISSSPKRDWTKPYKRRIRRFSFSAFNPARRAAGRDFPAVDCPRFSISVFARVESAANRLSTGRRRSRIAPVSSELTPCWSASAVWNATGRIVKGSNYLAGNYLMRVPP